MNFLEKIPYMSAASLFEMLLLTVLFYYIAKSLRSTRALVLLKGFAILGLVYAASVWFQLHVLQTILVAFFIVSGLTMVLVFNAEIRKFIEKIGTNLNIKGLTKGKGEKLEAEKYFSQSTIREIADALIYMAERKTGALIVLEKDLPVKNITATGITVDGIVTSQLLINIFEKNTPLHDGAVVIGENRVKAATCILPLTKTPIDKKYGTRHRAALGMAQEVDCCVLVVSEETGNISYMGPEGKIVHLPDRKSIIATLREIQEAGNTKESACEKREHFRLLKRTKHNFVMKISCALTAVFVWLTITMISDPITSVSYTVPIQVKNETAITSLGQIYELETKSVKANIKARASVVGKIKASDVKVTADLSKLSYTNAVPLSANLTMDTKFQNEIDLSTASVNVILDELTEISVPVTVKTIGNPKEGYYMESAIPEESTIMIKCGAKLAKILDRGVVTVKVDATTESFTAESDILLYDKNGAQIDKKQYTAPEKMHVNVDIKASRSIPVQVKIDPELQAVYNIQDVKISKQSITVIAPDKILNKLDTYTIVIDDIEITDPATKKYMKTVDITLPEGAHVADDTNSITVELSISPEMIKTITLSPEDIQIEDIPDGMQIDILNESIDIVVYGNQEEVDKMTKESIQPYISAKDLQAGKYNLFLQFKQPIYSSATVVNVDATEVQTKSVMSTFMAR